MVSPLLFASVVQSATNTWCIFSTLPTDKETQCKDLIEKIGTLADYPYQDSLAHADSSFEDIAYTGQTSIALIFSESLKLNAKQYKFLVDPTTITKTVKTYGCQLQVEYGADAFIIEKNSDVPLTFNYIFTQGTIKTAFGAITLDQINKLGLPVIFTGTIDGLTLTSTSLFPKISLEGNGKIAKITLEDGAIVDIKGDKLIYGSLEIDMNLMKYPTISLPTKTRIQLTTKPTLPVDTFITVTVPDATKTLIFEKSFKIETDQIFATANDEVIVVCMLSDVPQAPGAIHFIKKGTTDIVPQKVTEYCVSHISGVCAGITGALSLKPAEIKGLTNEYNFLYFYDKIIFETTDTIAGKYILFDFSETTSITQYIENAENQVSIFSDLSLPIFQFMIKPAASMLLATTPSMTITDLINPMIIQNSKGTNPPFFPKVTGFILTGSEIGTLDQVTKDRIKTDATDIPIQILSEETQILFEKDYITVDEVKIKTDIIGSNEVQFHVPPTGKLTFSKTVDATIPQTSVVSPVASIQFDRSFNGFETVFFTAKNAKEITSYAEGTPKWLTSDTLLASKPKPIETTKAKPPEEDDGLPSWGIALIVVASVIVIAVAIFVLHKFAHKGKKVEV